MATALYVTLVPTTESMLAVKRMSEPYKRRLLLKKLSWLGITLLARFGQAGLISDIYERLVDEFDGPLSDLQSFTMSPIGLVGDNDALALLFYDADGRLWNLTRRVEKIARVLPSLGFWEPQMQFGTPVYRDGEDLKQELAWPWLHLEFNQVRVLYKGDAGDNRSYETTLASPLSVAAV